jgi:hypothetical protein
MAILNQTLAFTINVDVIDKSRRTDHRGYARFSTGGNFTKMEALVQGESEIELTVPVTAIYIMATAIDLRVTWGAVTRTFKVNKLLFLPDMTDITSLSLYNPAVTAMPTRVILF